jgi:hypothetical protein
VWLLFNLGLLVWVAHVLYQSICMEGQPAPEPSAHGSLPPLISQPHFRMLLMFVGIVTFGPVFLDISIGQTSVLLLAMCIIIGQRMRQPDRWRNALVTAFAITLASITKLYPAAWLAALPLLRRWKQTVASLIVITSALSVSFLLMPDSSRAYWQQYLPQRVTSATEQVGMDDQSLLAWLDRISQPHIDDGPGIETGERIQIVWQPDWAFDQRAVQNVGYVLCGLLGIPIILALLRSEEALREGGFYLWVLYILVVFPHMERYNQTLLLPAMVWLWYRGRYNLVAAVYVFTGLSRLNHLWITLLPAPWGPLATGFGLCAVLSLIWGMLAEIKNQPIVTRLT